jgi:hypothetical protein
LNGFDVVGLIGRRNEEIKIAPLSFLPACGEKVGMRGPLGWAELRD